MDAFVREPSLVLQVVSNACANGVEGLLRVARPKLERSPQPCTKVAQPRPACDQDSKSVTSSMRWAISPIRKPLSMATLRSLL